VAWHRPFPCPPVLLTRESKGDDVNNRIFFINQKELVLRRPDESDYEVVPPDEPVFILRARDTKALGTIRVYQSLFRPTSEHWKTIQAVIDDFTEFKKNNPERMGDPEEVY